MTVPTTANRVQYNCDGETVEFAFNFPVYHKSNLIVVLLDTRTGVEETLVLDVDYEVSVPGGTVTLIGRFAYNPPDGNYKLTIIREIPLTQLIDLVNGDSMPADVLEEGYDRAVMLIQQLSERIGRSILLPVSSSVTGLTLPVPDPGKILKWNDGGDGFDNVNLADLSMQAVNAYWQDVLAASGVTLADVLTAMGLDPSLATLTLPDSVTISDFIKTLLDDTDAATARATLGVPDASDARRNVIINGDMRIAQRGTSVAASAGETYLVDRFSLNNQTDGAFTLSQYTASVPAGFRYSTYAAVSTADTSIGAAQYAGFCTKIEGYDFAPLVGKTCTLSFWVYSTRTGTYCVAFTNSGNDRAYIATYTINQASTWEYKTITVTFDFSGGTWNYTNGVGLKVWWMMACGSNYHATANAWQSGAYLATSSQVNVMQSTSDAFGVTGVQLEIGSAATQFEYRPYRHELALCQRYFVVFGASNDGQDIIGSGVSEDSSTAMALVNHPVEMRALPSLSYSSANHFAFRVASGGDNTATNITLSGISGTRDSWLSLTLATNPAAGYGGIVRSQTSGGRLYLSAEL